MAGFRRFDDCAEQEKHWALPCRRVLVVGGSHDVVDSHAMFRDTLGQDVRCAYDGAEALRIAIACRPELVLLRHRGHSAAGHVRTEDSIFKRLLRSTGVVARGVESSTAGVGASTRRSAGQR